MSIAKRIEDLEARETITAIIVSGNPDGVVVGVASEFALNIDLNLLYVCFGGTNWQLVTTEDITGVFVQVAGDTMTGALSVPSITDVGHMGYNIDPTVPTPLEGVVYWNAQDHTLSIVSGLGPILQVGTEEWARVYNDTGVDMPNGSIVHAETLVGTTDDVINVELARADVYSKASGILLVLTHDLPAGQSGFATHRGYVRHVDTSALSTGRGYMSTTVYGGIQNAKPQFPDYDLLMCVIVVSDVDGLLLVQPQNSIYDTFDNFYNGTFRESFDFVVEEAGGIVTGVLTPADGNVDMTMLFSDGFTTLDTSPSATVDLTGLCGSDTNPQTVYVYIPFATKTLTASTSEYVGEHINVSQLILQSPAGIGAYGALANHNWNDHIRSVNGQGHMSHLGQRIRAMNADWDSGAEATLTGTPSNVYIGNTSGIVYQLHKHEFPVIQMPTNNTYIVNDPSTPYRSTTNLNDLTVDATGATLTNRWFSVVVWGVANKTGQESHIMCNLPIGSYTSEDDAVNDQFNYSVFTLPRQFRGIAFLIARFTMRKGSTAIFTYDINVGYQDLRGFSPNASAGTGAGSSGITTFLGLSDTPSTYVSNGLKIPFVNLGETSIEFTNSPTITNLNITETTDKNYVTDVDIVTLATLPTTYLAIDGSNANQSIDIQGQSLNVGSLGVGTAPTGIPITVKGSNGVRVIESTTADYAGFQVFGGGNIKIGLGTANKNIYMEGDSTGGGNLYALVQNRTTALNHSTGVSFASYTGFAAGIISSTITNPITGEGYMKIVSRTSTGLNEYINIGNGSGLWIKGTADEIQTIVQGNSIQNVNLTEWQDSSGTPLTSITSDGRLLLPRGSATATAIGFIGDENTGIVSRDHILDLYADGTLAVAISANVANWLVNLRMTDGSLTNLAQSFGNDPDTGLYRGSAGKIRHVSDGVQIWQYNESGVGIGIDSNLARLHIKGTADEIQTIVQANSIQTVNLTEWQDYLGDALSGIDKRGILFSNGGVHITNFFAGDNSGNIAATGFDNTGVGSSTLRFITTGSYNSGSGANALRKTTTGSFNTGSGTNVLFENVNGTENNGFGRNALRSLVSGNKNVAMGNNTLYSVLGNANVGIGYKAGYFETGSNKLYISNTDTSTPLIYGEFDTFLLRVNGHQEIIGNADTQQLVVQGNTIQNVNIVDILAWDNETLLSIDNVGWLGIGEKNPQSPLHVLNESPIITIEDSVDGVLGKLGNANDFFLGGVAGNLAVQFNNKITIGSGSQIRVTITNAGRIGIGYANPTALLHIRTDLIEDIGLTVQGADGQTGNLTEWQDYLGNVLTVIDENGNVGIGTDAPQQKLDVNGGSNIDGLNIGTANYNGTYGDLEIHNLSADANMSIFNASGVRLDAGWVGNTSYITTTSLMPLILNEAGGKVGVGIFSPLSKLHVAGTADEIQHIVQANATQTVNISEWRDGIGNPLSVVDASGHLGIGTSAPNALLEIASNSFVSTPVFRINDLAQSSSWTPAREMGSIEFYTSDASYTARVISAIKQVSGKLSTSSGASGTLTFSTSNYTGSIVERMRIDDSGNVGIGTTNPLAKLYVEGNSDIEQLIVRGYTGQATNIVDILAGDNTSLVSIDNIGNLGIGEKNPAATLHIVSTVPMIKLDDSAYGEVGNIGNANNIFLGGVDGDLGINSSTGDIVFGIGSAQLFKIDNSTTTGNTRFMVWDVDNATMERVTVGTADSGGTGYKVLRIPN